ncbi:unnamed protein product [Camellia sinensis]
MTFSKAKLVLVVAMAIDKDHLGFARELLSSQKLLGEIQNIVKEFKNFVFQVFSFFNICNHSYKLFINSFLYSFEHSTFIYKIYDVISFNMWL